MGGNCFQGEEAAAKQMSISLQIGHFRRWLNLETSIRIQTAETQVSWLAESHCYNFAILQLLWYVKQFWQLQISS